MEFISLLLEFFLMSGLPEQFRLLLLFQMLANGSS